MNEERRRVGLPADPLPCPTCKFTLRLPIAKLEVSTLGLHMDARYPGRSLLRLDEHYDDWRTVPKRKRVAFMDDWDRAALAVKDGMEADHMNDALLGNAERHVHWHLIPRKFALEPNPHKAPWDRTDPFRPLSDEHRDRVIAAIARRLV
jgi:diadenosine tetraphosphate (Ap4A) HIT family hydrolase